VIKYLKVKLYYFKTFFQLYYGKLTRMSIYLYIILKCNAYMKSKISLLLLLKSHAFGSIIQVLIFSKQ
jgi:hypothetical protein